MMKLTLLTAAFAAVLSLAGVSAQAQTTNAASTTTMAPASKSTSADKMSYGGTVAAVDTTANTIEVKSKKHDLTLMADTTTTYKGATALADIKVGDKVRGSYTKDASGKMMACSINKKMAK